MDALIRRDGLTSEQALEVGGQVARLHAEATQSHEGADYRELVDHNFEALLPLVETLIPARERLALQRFAAAFLLGWAAVLEARAKAGSVVEGHGDLRAENVVFDSGDVFIVDRTEPEASRIVDVADDLGSLIMGLSDAATTRTARDAILAGYVDAGGSAQPDALLAFFGACRAQFRATAVLRAAQLEVGSKAAREEARRLLALSSRLGWRARGPLLLLVTGPSVAGKSTLARALGRVSGLPVVSPHEAGPEPDERLDDTLEAYADLARRASRERAVIVDATFGDPQLQRAFIEQLGSATRPLAVECRAPSDVRVARAASRRRQEPDAGAHPRAGRPPAEQFTMMRGLADDALLTVDTRAPVSIQVDEVASWLDSLMAAGGI